jgi:hypothetical protein
MPISIKTIHAYMTPIVCESPGCRNEGAVINRIAGIVPADIDAFFEDYDGSGPDDVCPLCHAPGIAADPELSIVLSVPAGRPS